MVAPVEQRGGNYSPQEVAGFSHTFQQVAKRYAVGTPQPRRDSLIENKFSRTSVQIWGQTAHVRDSVRSGEVKLPTAYVEGACDAAAVMQMVSLIESGTPRPSDGTWYWRPYPGAQEEVFARMQHLFSAMAAIIKDPSYFSNDPNYVSDTESHRRELIAFALDELKSSRQRSQTSQAEEYLLGMEVVRQQWRNLSGQA